MAGSDPVNDQFPSEDGGYQSYKAAGKLAGKKALIAGDDSGIGRAIAIPYALEGVDSAIVFTSQEEKDAKDTKALVEKKGKTSHLILEDLKSVQTCKSVV